MDAAAALILPRQRVCIGGYDHAVKGAQHTVSL